MQPLLPLLFNLNGKPYTLADHFPFSPHFRTQIPRKRITKTGRQVSKCLSLCPDDVVRLADGRQVAATDVRVGDPVLSLVDGLEFGGRPVVAVHENGRQPIYTLKTRLGSEFSVTAEHRFRTLYGYTRVAELSPGTRVAAVRRGGLFLDAPVARERIVFTAYMLGDGCRTGRFSFINADPDVLAEMEAVVTATCGAPPRREATRSKASTLELSRRTRLGEWFREDGLFDKRAWDKSLPGWVYRLSRADTALFLSRIWAPAGTICVSCRGHVHVQYATTSRALARGVRSLLNKLGIPAAIQRRATTCNGKRCRDAFDVRVETRPGIEAFYREIVVPGKPARPLPDVEERSNRDTVPIEVAEALARLAAPLYRQRGNTAFKRGLRVKPLYSPSRRRLREYIDYFSEVAPADHPDLALLRDLRDGGITWDLVESIEPAGEAETLDIEVEGTHNYVLDGVVSHNSTSMASSSLTLSLTNPHFSTLCITPLFEQIRRFSNNYIKPFIDLSPVRSLLVDTSCDQSVLQRTFLNHSKLIFSYAFLDSSRIRGISACRCVIDEFQDMDMRHIPIIAETMSYAPPPWGITDFTGTPKGFDNPMERFWQTSSQAEWFVKCPRGGCGHYNIASAEHDLLAMIGPLRDDISPERPATVCARCRRPIDPRTGFWRHRYPERRWSFQGFHVPQVIMPIHYGSRDKWMQLLDKMAGGGNTAPHVFHNEVLGESYDVGSKLLTLTELKAAAVLPWDNDPAAIPEVVLRRRQSYLSTVLAVDWGGGGGEMMTGRSEAARRQRVSFTTLAFLGIRADGKVDCLWGRRLRTPNDHIREAMQVLAAINELQPTWLAHDFTGAGSIRETLLAERGFPQERTIGIAYAHAPTRAIMIRVAEDAAADVRGHYRVDKTRTILTTIAAIRTGIVRFFRYDARSDEDPGLLADFLALTEEKVEHPGGADVYIIRRLAAFPDDFAHAVNIGCCALWHRYGWPDLAAGVHVSPDSLEAGGWTVDRDDWGGD